MIAGLSLSNKGLRASFISSEDKILMCVSIEHTKSFYLFNFDQSGILLSHLCLESVIHVLCSIVLIVPNWVFGTVDI